MAKKYYEGDLDLSLDWGGKVDAEGNEQLPLSGNQVQELLKSTLNSKVGWVGINEANGKYVLTKDEATFTEYIKTVTADNKDGDKSLILGEFKAPYEYSAEITLTNPSNGYLAVLKGETGLKIKFYAKTKDAQGNVIGEAYSYRITCTQNDGTQKVYPGSISAPKEEEVITPVEAEIPIDSLISVGTNTLTISVTGINTDAVTYKTVTVKVINLSITDTFDISKTFTFNGTNNEILSVFHEVTTNSKTTVYWYIDKDLKGTTSFNATGNNTFTYNIAKDSLHNGVHTLMFYAEAFDSEISSFKTPLYYRNFFVADDYSGSKPLFSMSFELPYDEAYLDKEKDVKPSIFNAQEYAAITLPFAIYTDLGETPVSVMIAEGGSDVFETYTTIVMEPSRVIKQKVVLTKEGEAKIKLVSGNEESFVIGPFDVKNNPLISEPDNSNVIFSLNAKNRNNKEEHFDTWVSTAGGNTYAVKFNNFKWNTNSGWNDGKLIISNGSSIEIPFAPFANSSLYNNGYTFEIEFSTKNIYDEDGVVCEIMNDEKTSGIKITASEAIFYIDATQNSQGEMKYRKVSSKFKSGETYRIAFVKTPTGDRATDFKNSRFIKLYVNGVLCGLEEFDFATVFAHNSNIVIQGTKDVEIELSSIEITQKELSHDEVLNNYMFNRPDANLKNQLYTDNNIYNDDKEISPDKLKEQIPVMIFYQLRNNKGAEMEGVERIEEEFSDKGYQIWMDIDYTDPYDETRSFYWANACVRPQGTSSMKYPKKNFRIYTQKDKEGGDLDRTMIYEGVEKTNYLKAKNENKPYPDKYEPTEAEKNDPKAIKKKLKTRTYSFHDNAAKVKCWCLKADFAESSGTHNTGVARWWNDVMKNGKFLTSAQNIANANDYEYDVRTTVDGFPIGLFYKPLDDKLRFLGKYNFNNDKSTEDVFGFTGGKEIDSKKYEYIPIGYTEPIIHTETEKNEYGQDVEVPLADITEDRAIFENPDKDSPTYAYIDGLYYMLQTPEMFSNPRMECWEILSSGSKVALFQQTEWTYDKKKEKIGYYDETNTFQDSFESRFPDCGEFYHTYNLDRFIKWLTSCQYLKVENNNGEGKLVPMTLDELKALPEYPKDGKLTIHLHAINKPAEDTFKFSYDGDASYSKTTFEEISADVTKKEYDDNNKEILPEGYRIIFGLTSEDVDGLIVREIEGKDIPEDQIDDCDLIKINGYYYIWGYKKIYYTTSTVLPKENDGYNYICIYPSFDYYIWKDFEEFSKFLEPQELDDTPRNRALKFAVEKYEHFNLDLTAAYYVYLMRFGGVDQTVKNAMMTTEGSLDNRDITLPSRWYFINYDNDTILGVKNDGTLVFDPYMTRNTIEESTDKGDFYCYAGRNSTMWNNFEADTDFMSLVPSIDAKLNTDGGLNYKNTIEMFNEKQAGQWCESVYNWDARVKYIDTYTTHTDEDEQNAKASYDYLLNVQGPRSAHREWWLSKRFNIFDSYYTTGTFKSDVVTFKCNGPSPQDDEAIITSGEDVYYGYYKNNTTSAFKTPTTIKPGDTWKLTVTKDSTIGDPHAIFGSPNIEKIDFRPIAYRLTELQMAKIKNESVGTKLKELLIGDHDNPQIITSFQTLGDGKRMEKLEVLDLTGCEEIDTLETVPNMKKVYLAGSGIRSVDFSNGGNIELLELPVNLVSLTLNETTSLTWDAVQFNNIKVYGNNYCIKEPVTDLSMLKNFTALEIIDTPELLKDHNFILNWLNSRKELGGCRITLNPIEWHLTGDEVEKLMVFGEIPQKNIAGKIYIDRKLTLDEVVRLSDPDLFGVNCFTKNARLEIIAEEGVYLTSKDGKGDTILEGDDKANEYKLILVGGDGNIIPEKWLIIAQEIGENGIPITIRNGNGIDVTSTIDSSLSYNVKVDELERTVKYISISLTYDNKLAMDEPYTIQVIKRTYPSGTYSEITGPNSISETGVTNFTLSLKDENGEDYNGNGDFFTEWSVSGDAYDKTTEDGKRWIEKGNANTLSCEVIANYLMSSKFVLTVSLYKTLQGKKTLVFTTKKQIGLSNPDILLVREDNPALFQRLYDFGFTTDDSQLTKQTASYIDPDYAPKGMAFKNIFKGYLGYKSNEDLENIDIKFEDFSQLSSFSSIGTIAPEMFKGCTNLKTIALPNFLRTIEKDAFNGCTALNNITIPNAVIRIGEGAFNGCGALKTITVPNSVTTLERLAFANCTALTTTIIGSGITEIPERAFYDSTALKNITFNGDIRVINNNAFEGCVNLEKLVLSESIENIVFSNEASPFMRCYKLYFEGGNEKYEVVDGTLYFNDADKKWLMKQNPNEDINDTEPLYAIAYGLCGMKKSYLEIPSNIIFAGTNVLNGSTGDTIKLTKRMQEHENCYELLSETKYTGYVFADGETNIPARCFKKSTSTAISLPSTITTIGSEAFLSCHKLTNITIPSQVKLIGNRAFNDTLVLETIYFEPVEVPERETVADNNDIIHEVTRSLTTMYVNGDSLNAYREAWDDYKEYIQLKTLPVNGYFRIIENGAIHFSPVSFGSPVNDVKLGNNIVLKQLSNGYYYFETYEGNTNTTIRYNGGSYEFKENYCTIFVGDNTSLYDGRNGIDFTRGIYTNQWLRTQGILISESSNKTWFYDSNLKGYRSPSLMSSYGESSIGLNLKAFADENGEIIIKLGQSSESAYDYLKITDNEKKAVEFEIVGTPTKVSDLKNIRSNDVVIKLPVRESYYFTYSKDGSKDMYFDCVWIKSIGIPVFNEPILDEEYVEDVTINVNVQGNVIDLPAGTIIKITNGTYYNAEFMVDDGVVTTKLPKNETYHIIGEDFMIGNKHYMAFEPYEINTSTAVGDISLSYTWYDGAYYLDKDGNVIRWEDGKTSNVYLFSDSEGDYYIYADTYTSKWSTEAGDKEDELYITLSSNVMNSQVSGYDNTKLINSKFGEKAPIVKIASNINAFKKQIEWYIPSWNELDKIRDNALGFLLNGKELWTSNLKDAKDAWRFMHNSDKPITTPRDSELSIMVFGKRKI